MRNRIFGGIGVVWGAAIILSMLLKGGPTGQGGYAAGQIAAMVFGGLLFVAGLYYLVKGDEAGRGR